MIIMPVESEIEKKQTGSKYGMALSARNFTPQLQNNHTWVSKQRNHNFILTSLNLQPIKFHFLRQFASSPPHHNFTSSPFSLHPISNLSPLNTLFIINKPASKRTQHRYLKSIQRIRIHIRFSCHEEYEPKIEYEKQVAQEC